MVLHRFDPPEGFAHDPYPYYRRLLAADGPAFLQKSDETGIPGVWLVSRYDDALEILKATGGITKNPARVAPAEHRRPGLLDGTMLHADPPDHTRLRRVVRDFFAPRAIDALAPAITGFVDDLLAGVLRRPACDFIAEFATPLPMHVISRLLGLPPDDAEHLRSLATTILQGTDTLQKTAAVYAAQQDAARDLAAYFADQLDRRRRARADDLLSALVIAHDEHGTLDAGELHKMCVFLLITGFESTVSLLGNGLLTLLRFPTEATRLAADPRLIPAAVEEMLRYESPFQRTSFRAFTEPCTVRGHRFEPGEQVAVILGAANRDPARFPDPDRFDAARTPNPHLAFGAGLHQCLGAQLARVEARAAFARLVPHLSRFMLAAEPRWHTNSVVRTLAALPLSIRAEA
ncbi:MAG: cytochrome P450 [Planctomycetia bacterium]